ncbi:MAG: fused MFS/spermidine synthase, partial [Anaerolineae bacterium]|nr:fused MFS/spermidine synthase [Anaerolineae bacterium]
VRIDDENEDLRILTLDRLVHSYVDLTDPTNLRYGYEQIYADVLDTLFPDNVPVSALFIGGGGYTFPHYIEVVHPGSQIEVIEIDPGVTHTAYEQLGLPADTAITSYNEDARHFITNLPSSTRYDLIVGDAFNDFSVPYHLTTLEFNERIAAHLNAGGIYMVNIIDGKQGYFLRAYVNTLQQTFAHVYVAATVGELGSVSRQTYVILATQNPLDASIEDSSLVQTFLTPAEVTTYLQERPPLLLTDDYVPVDNLLAPVFADSGS